MLRWMRWKAKQRAVVDQLSRTVPNDKLAQVISLVPENPILSVRVVELALQIIDLRLELGDPPFEGGDFNDPRIESRR